MLKTPPEKQRVHFNAAQPICAGLLFRAIFNTPYRLTFIQEQGDEHRRAYALHVKAFDKRGKIISTPIRFWIGFTRHFLRNEFEKITARYALGDDIKNVSRLCVLVLSETLYGEDHELPDELPREGWRLSNEGVYCKTFDTTCLRPVMEKRETSSFPLR